METWPHRFMGRYPPWHYMVLRAAYEPALAYWRSSGQIVTSPQTGEWEFTPPHATKIGALLLLSGLVSAVMAVGAGLVLMRAARAATGDAPAGWLASAAFMSLPAVSYFAHLGNVDVPAMFWLACSLLFYVRLLRSRRAIDAALLGLFAALTSCTKDNWVGIYPGMMVVLLVEEWRRRRAENAAGASLLRAAWQSRWGIGILTFVIPYVIINAIPWNARAYMNRLGGWLSPMEGSWILREHRRESMSLLVETVRQAASGVGWPMLAALAAGAAYMLVRRPRLAIIMLVPVITYYAIVIEHIDFVYERFLFGPLMLLSVLLGAAAADLIRNVRLPGIVRFGIPVAVILPTIAYSAAIDLEMVNDSRYAAEDWFRNNVPPTEGVGAVAEDLKFFSPQYLPRVHEMGYATYPVVCTPAEFQRPQPEYLMLSSFHHQDFAAEAMSCASELLAGRLGYERVAVFGSRYLGTGSSWLSLAGWGAPVPGKVSPTITILRRLGSQP
jgi:hypothetical protein